MCPQFTSHPRSEPLEPNKLPLCITGLFTWLAARQLLLLLGVKMSVASGQGRTGHLAYRANGLGLGFSIQYWGCLGPFGALQMHQNTLKCPLGPYKCIEMP